VQSLNDLGLHHQLQVRGVTTIKDALREGEAYLLAKQLHRAHLSSQQVTVEPKEDHNGLGHSTHVATTTTTNSPLEAEVDRMADMLEKLVVVLARSKTLAVEGGAPKVNCSMLGMWWSRTSPYGLSSI